MLFTTNSGNAFNISSLNINTVTHELCVSSPNTKGYLTVSDKHTLHYATYGNPEGIPVVVLHGGPGFGCDDTLSRFFDLKEWHVIMFDQRGAMRSKPFGCMKENTPQCSVEDIEKLREHLGIERWTVFGGSWGSALALLYGQAHPERCLGFVLRGIFLGREQDYLHLLYDMGKIFPDAYDAFAHHLPKEEQGDILTAYYKRLMDEDPNIHMPAAQAFMKYNIICSTHLPNNESLEKLMSNDALILGVARAYFYYSYHHFFLTPNQILSQMDKIAHLPAIIVHGRWDAICLPESAYTLHKQWPNSALWIIPDGGHSANDPTIAQGLVGATNLFAHSMKQEN
jgi:proline iminopeptidase